MASAALGLLLDVLVQQAHEASGILGSGYDDLLLDWRVLLLRPEARLKLLGWQAVLALALLSVALEAGEGLGQILKRKVLQEHSEANTYVGSACSGLRARAARLRVMHGRGPLHQSFAEVWIVQVLLEKALKVLPNVDVDLLALSQVLYLFLEDHGLHLVFL